MMSRTHLQSPNEVGCQISDSVAPLSPTAFGLSAVPTAQAGVGRPGPRHPPLRRIGDNF